MSDYILANTSGSVSTAINEAAIKEQTQDLLINLFPLDVPLQRTLGRIQMNSTFIKQPIDTYGSDKISRVSTVFAARGDSTFAGISAKPEGFTYTTNTPQYPALLKSVAEIQGNQFAVSGTDRAISMYGISDRFALEALKTTQGIVNQFEMSFWWSPGSTEFGNDLNNTGTNAWARQTQGLVHWLCKSGLQRSKIGLGTTSFTDGHGNEFGTNSAALNTGASSWAYDANGAPLDQAMFKDNLMGQWYAITGRQAGAMGFTGARVKNLFSQFALTANGAINERTLSAEARSVIDTIDYYTTDFGTVGLSLSRYLNLSGSNTSVAIAQSAGSVTVPYDEVLLFIDPAYWKIGVLRPVSFYSVGRNRDAEEGQVIGEQAMVCLNPQGGAAIVNCLP
jgi:hypothetical protein